VTLIAVKTDTEATSRGVGCVVRTAEGLMFCGLTTLLARLRQNPGQQRRSADKPTKWIRKSYGVTGGLFRWAHFSRRRLHCRNPRDGIATVRANVGLRPTCPSDDAWPPRLIWRQGHWKIKQRAIRSPIPKKWRLRLPARERGRWYSGHVRSGGVGPRNSADEAPEQSGTTFSGDGGEGRGLRRTSHDLTRFPTQSGRTRVPWFGRGSLPPTSERRAVCANERPY
jgi:hypothetical protein